MIVIRLQTRALDELQAKARQIGKEIEVAMVGARGAANLVRQHLFDLDARSPRSHFYSASAKSVHEPRPEGKGAAFVVTKIGLAQRWLGGTIRAGKGTSSATGGPTKYLAVPAREEAHDKTPAEFSDLVFVPRRNGKAMLVQALQTSILGGSGRRLKNPGSRAESNTTGGLVMFWLVTQVTQRPDPSVMPTQEELGAAAVGHIDNYLSRLLQTSDGGGAN